MISDMLFLEKAENGLVLVHEEVVDLAHEVPQLFDFYELSAEESASTCNSEAKAPCTTTD